MKTIGLLSIFTFLVIPSHASESATLPCERYVTFLNPGNSFAKEYAPDAGLSPQRKYELQAWSDKRKKIICDALCKIQKKAPGLVARASNGEKIKLLLTRYDDSSVGMAAPASGSVYCSPGSLDPPPESVQCFLAHEFVHLIDRDEYLTRGREWNQLIVPYLDRYRQMYNEFETWHVVDPRAAELGLPSGYAASNPGEALAECTKFIVVRNWKAPSAIQSFIMKNVLAEPQAVNIEAKLLRQAILDLPKQPLKAIATYTEVLRIDPDCIPVWEHLSYAWDAEDEPELAAFCVNEAAQLLKKNGVPPYDKDFAICHFVLGSLYLDQSDLKKAMDEFNKAIKLDPQYEDAYCVRGVVYDHLKQERNALADFERAIVINPEDGWPYRNRAISYYNTGQYSKAMMDANKAIIRKTVDNQIYNTRGRAYEAQGKYRQAIEDYTKAIAYQHKWTVPYKNRARVYEILGQVQLAAKDRQSVKELGPGNDEP